jgi:hypothetical protein
MADHTPTLEPFEDSDDLVTLTTRRTEFEAHTVVAILQDAGIEAFAFGAVQTVLPLTSRLVAVPIQVRKRDLDRARQAIQQNVADSVDLDWDEVDVGERVDDLPLKDSRDMPIMAMLGYITAVLMVFLMIFGALWLMKPLL